MGQVGGTFSHNLFAYCNNDPIDSIDPSGHANWWPFKSGFNFLSLSDYIQWGILQTRMKDNFAKRILFHWIYGCGKKLVIKNDKSWNKFFAVNSEFKKKVREKAKAAIMQNENTFSYHGNLTLTEHGGGDYSTGYGLLNGSNKEAGDFVLEGFIVATQGKKQIVKVQYIFNDIIDPNAQYQEDIVYAIGANLVFGLDRCFDYTLSISGTMYMPID
jgi:hypothetical protein